MNENRTVEARVEKKVQKRYWREIKGLLYARLQYRDETGKWREKLKPITDKRTARSAVEEMRRELETHGEQTLQSNKMTFDELAENYSETRLVEATYSNGVKVSGRRSLAAPRAALKPLQEFFGRKMLRSIKPSDLEAYKTRRLSETTKRGTHRKLATVNRELALLRTMFNYALQNDWIIQNPFGKAKGIISLSAEVERERVLSFNEEKRLLEACAGRRSHLKPLIICALDTAMRRGEIFKMRWRDVDFETNKIHIPQTNTKTEDARIVGMTPRLREALEGLWEVSPKEREQIVFGITNSIKKSFATACNDASIKDFRFHDCRHTATTRMIASGSPHTEVMKITGHTQLKTFLRYLNITPETAKSVASRLNIYLTEGFIQFDPISSAVN